MEARPKEIASTNLIDTNYRVDQEWRKERVTELNRRSFCHKNYYP